MRVISDKYISVIFDGDGIPSSARVFILAYHPLFRAE